jgi:tellurite resistance protein
MSYLYGDSTPSPLEINFIEFLGDCLDFSAQLVASTESMRREGENGEALRRAAHADTQRLERLAVVVSSAVKDISNGQVDNHTTRCAVAIVRSANDLVRTEIESVNSVLQAELAKLDANALAERAKCAKALETLLLRHDLPHTRRSLTLKTKAGAAYAARLRISTPFGIAATLDLEVPASHLFGHPLRVDRLIDRLEVQAPDVGGWLQKGGKIRPQRLEKLYVMQLDIDAAESFIKLRSSVEGTGPGFDVMVGAEEPRVRLVRAGDRESAAEQPFDVSGTDEGSVLVLLDKLEAASRDLAGHRKALVASTLDDRPLSDHDNPSVLVERLVAAMAPITQEIARRSPSNTELVLKRLVGGGRREEIFVTKAELLKRIEHLPAHLRSMFDPLALGSAFGALPIASAASAPAGGVEPPTLVMARRSPDARSGEPSRSASVASDPVIVSSQVDVGESDTAEPNGQLDADWTRGD